MISELPDFQSNMFTVLPNATLICTVNCVGVMGKGIALQFKNRFPNLYLDYVKACNDGNIKIGKCWRWNPPPAFGPDIICFPTKQHWALPSKIEYISKGLINLKKMESIYPIVIPKLGCGNGGLKWNEVKKLIVSELGDLEQKYVICA